MNVRLDHPLARSDDTRLLVFDADLYKRLTLAGAFVDAGRVELIDGVIIQMNAQAVPHMRVKGDLAYRLRRAIDDLGLSLRVDQEGSVQLSNMSVPEPDILIWDGVATTGFVDGRSVVLIVEVADTTLAKDLTLKAELYAAAGVPEYWIADVNGRAIHRYSSAREDGYGARAIFRFGEQIDSVAIPGLGIDLGDL
ncbi:Uma2 family endonuclease [Glacieibacterium sp.]|uniref:Uma2 family endonuclease n=1 Tax=Glacieibacterium sp. TaxID=2860237 RepID=UPI003AFF64E4